MGDNRELEADFLRLLDNDIESNSSNVSPIPIQLMHRINNLIEIAELGCK